MQYANVCIEALGYALPAEIVTSAEIEDRLAPLYERLRLPAGRLELMTGIRERRLWPRGMRPSAASAVSGRRALAAAEFDPARVGALVHASVCRDFVEPATACGVHHALGLSEECAVYDVSNACLGLMNGMLQVANMIELGQIEAGLVVGTEDSRALLENTIAALNADVSLTRQQIKSAVASLTIGSASCAVLLVDRRVSRTKNRLVAGILRARTRHHELCQSVGQQHLMATDSERLMQAGVTFAAETFSEFLAEVDWTHDQINATVGHQVGQAHRKLLLEALGLPHERDFTTVEWLGNTGSVALPVTLAIGLEQHVIRGGQHVGLLGIGSGLNCLMLGVEWQRTLPGVAAPDGEPAAAEMAAP